MAITEQAARRFEPASAVVRRSALRKAGARRRGVALGLGVFSIALGAALLGAPRAMATLIGVRPRGRRRAAMRAVGAREIAAGIGLLSSRRASPWLWGRFGGDLMDLALLGAALRSPRRLNRARTMAALATVAGISFVDLASARTVGRLPSDSGRVVVTKATTVNRPPDEVYRFWRDFQNFPRFMSYVESVRVEDGISTWRAKGPMGTSFEWQAEMVADEPGSKIAWRSRPQSQVHHSGSVEFRPAPGGRGTDVTVALTYEPPAGTVGYVAAKLVGRAPGEEVDGDLRRFKQVIETGEVMHSDASIHAGPHPARPSNTTASEG